MNSSPEQTQLGIWQKIFLLSSAIILAFLLFFLRGGVDQQKALDYLARSSIEPQIALKNGKPTIIEFYADWCEVCREMAPIMLEIFEENQENINLVMLNVDNPKWEELIDKYDVNGIPHFNLFSKEGDFKGKLIGAKSKLEVKKIVDFLVKDVDLTKDNNLMSYGKTSAILLDKSNNNSFIVKPRSHS